MATWKKVIVSGSAGEFTSVTSSVLTNDQLLIAGVGGAIENSGISYDGSNVALGSSTITSTGATSILSGSFSGSFQGDGSNLTGVVAAIPNSLLLGDGLAGGTFDGQTAVTASVDTGSAHFEEGVRKQISVADTTGAAGIDLSYNQTTGEISGSLVNSSITLGTTPVDLGATETTLDGLTLTDVEATGSFTGSFTGTFVGTTNLPDLTSGTGISTFTYDGATTATVAVSGASTLSANRISKWTGDAFANSSLTDNGTTITGTTSLQLSGDSSSLTGSFTGSFKGDGSGLTGLATTLDVSASNGSGISIDLLTQDLTITGTANEIETSAVGTTLTIGLPDDVTITQDLTVSRDLVVSRNLTVLGTASFQSTTNLDVADRFILMASGSNTTGDGGIVIQQGTQGFGEAFGFDVAAPTRWGVTGSFDGSQATFTPDAFMAAVVVGAGIDPTAAPDRYEAKGNIFVSTDESIYIYS